MAKNAYIPGGDAKHMLDAVSVLRSMEGEEEPLLGRKVVVYGGGNTAIDVARSAKRMGAEPLIIYRRTREKMPAHDFEVEEALQEGVSVKWLSTITEAEKVTANQLVRDIVKTSMETVSTSTLTSQKSFNGSYEIRNYLETALNEKCAADARQIQQAVKNKDSREKAWKPYLSDENFNTWFEQITKDINEKMKDSDA